MSSWCAGALVQSAGAIALLGIGDGLCRLCPSVHLLSRNVSTAAPFVYS